MGLDAYIFSLLNFLSYVRMGHFYISHIIVLEKNSSVSHLQIPLFPLQLLAFIICKCIQQQASLGSSV